MRIDSAGPTVKETGDNLPADNHRDLARVCRLDRKR
jgi:hypothetical protein